MVRMLAIDQDEREMAQRKSSYCSLAPNPHNFTDLWVRENQFAGSLEVAPKTVAQARTLALIPSELMNHFSLGEKVGPNRLCHLPKTSRSTRRRKSSQSEVTNSPASTAAQRRSISSIQAPSTSASCCSSRLSSNRAARSARSC